MRNHLFLFATLAAIYACNSTPEQNTENKQFNYPETRKDTTVVDDYFGTKVADPYRWLEDDHSPETEAWVAAQRSFTEEYLSKIPQRAAIKKRLKELWNYARNSAPWHKGKYWFQYKNNGEQNQSVLYIGTSPGGCNRILIDPNKLSEDGTVALAGLELNMDASFMAFKLSEAGSDWTIIKVLETATGKILDDELNWVKFSGMGWQGDGFYYSRYQEPEEGKELTGKNQMSRLYYHKIGTTQDNDQLVYEDEAHPDWSYGINTTDDESIEILNGWESTSGSQFAVRQSGKDDWIWLDSTFEAEYSLVDKVSDHELLVLTNNGAPKKRLVRIDINHPDINNWVELIPENEHLLESVISCGGMLIAQYLEDVKTKLYVYDRSGEKKQEISLPGIGIASIGANRHDTVAYYTFTNYVTPTRVYRYNTATGENQLFWEPEIDFHPADYTTEQVFYKSKDGTRIPMFITYKKGLVKDGNNPCFLYGYGGFNISNKPYFSVQRSVFLEQGGIYAVPNIRGGGEYGQDWHWAGTKLKKQNVFDDFIAAGEYLIRENYTSTPKLACHGRSNGGLLIGAVMTQRPDLWGCCIPKVGVLDMLRYHLFTIGWAWAVDYGRSDEEDQFPNLLSYSPLHNVKDTCYPPTLVVTGDHDDRVVPGHSFKFAATLQAKNTCDSPMLIRIDKDSGHGAGKPLSKQIDEFGDQWAFVFYHLGMTIK